MPSGPCLVEIGLPSRVGRLARGWARTISSAVKVMANIYRDSVTLMQLSASLAKLPGIERALR